MPPILAATLRIGTMRPLWAPLIGLPLGLLGAVLAALWLGPSLPRVDLARFRPAPIDTLMHPVLATGLPRVLPMPSDRLQPPADATAQASGTGFFAAPHLLVTAAHVVEECRSIQLVSQYFSASEARVLAVDADNDIALLVTTGRAPAELEIADQGRTPGRMLVYGYPAGAIHDTPATAWAGLANDRFAASVPLERDPRTLLWMQTHAIAHGYSGGPIMDPGSGQVVGIVRALIDPQRAAAAYGIAMPDLSIGPGTAPLRAILARSATAAAAREPDDDDIFTRARKATAHVFCWQ